VDASNRVVKKPRVLIIENSVHVTGALKSVTRTAYDLRNDFDFVFIIPKGSAGRFWIEAKGFKNIYEVSFVELSKRIWQLLRYIPCLMMNAREVRRIAEEEKIDVIHVNDLYNLIPAMMRLIGGKIPYVCHIRFLPDKFPAILFNSWFRFNERFAHSIVAVSHYLKSKLPDSPKLHVIPNELPVEEKYDPSPLESGAPLLLYLSNVIPGKGHTYALESFAQVTASFPEWRLRFVGGDMGLEKNKIYLESLKERAKELGLVDQIDWLPFAEDVEREYKTADIVLNFSESESFSITCLEALFFGRPLIVTDCGGPAEIVTHEETGILVPNRDLERMIEAMRRLMSDPHLRNRLASNARVAVRSRFSIQNTSLRLKDIYHSILRG
jgi:glycosyltransferase involved in cell wall biosynthesis